MKRLVDLNLKKIWLNPDHTVEAGRVIVNGLQLRFVAVMEGGLLRGIVSADTLRTSDPQRMIRDLMFEPRINLDDDTTVARAAEAFADPTADVAAVFHEQSFVGLLTPSQLLPELRRPWDSRTNLGTADRLREWAVEALRQDKEISILFFDLNDFGAYNKKHGHIVGDRILKRFANFLKDRLDVRRDLLVRYAGDEFVIGTLRLRDDAEAFAAEIKNLADQELFDDVGGPITFCVGVSGGRRTGPRPETHLEANIDDLINSASRAAQKAKEALKRRALQVEATPNEANG